ncbi:MAG: DNA-binding protein [Lachnospiraceae bacterium]|nr:DNA-binding protein [Lachnospiraceae bacterium]
MNESFSADEQLKDIYELTRLYDMYGVLLSEHNREIFEDYMLNDLSLGEIADEQGISRQGVRDTVRRCSGKLKSYEDKLGMLKKLDDASGLINKLELLVKDEEGQKTISQIKNLFEL